VDESWRIFFEGFDLARVGTPSTIEASRQTSVVRLIDAYRSLGHLCARLDPLSDPPPSSLVIDLADFGISAADLERTFDTSHFLGLPSGTLKQLLEALEETYCRSI